MTRVVVHIGAQRTGSEALHRGLKANEDVLALHGVLVPMSGRHLMSPNAVRHHPLAWSIDPGPGPEDDTQVWDSLADEIAGSAASTALLSSELFAPIAADPKLAPVMLDRLRRVSDDITLVFFVREQLSLLNSLYGQRVKALDITDAFDTYLERSADVELYDLASFRSWYDDPPVRFVSVPWDVAAEADPFAALLAASDIPVLASELRTPAETYGENLGPIGIEATRLLGAYLRGKYRDFQPTEHAARRLKRRAATEALAQGWCDDEFWGWSTRRADALVGRYARSNQEFAQHSWGGDWTLPAPLDRLRNAAELVELDAGTVQRVHRFVNNMERLFARLRTRPDET